NYGAEILRLWVAGEDYRDNIRLSTEILQRLTEAYRRIRNTCRYLIGNLHDFHPAENRIPYNEMEELDRFALHRLQELCRTVLKAYDDFEFHLIYHSLHNFCVLDLSSFYLDIIKDRIYTSAADSKKRRSAQTAMNEILETLARLMAPILSFTADELWSFMPEDPERPASVHADMFIPVKEEFIDPELASRWEVLLLVRKEVSRALETARKEKRIGHSLDAVVTLGCSKELLDQLTAYREDLRSIFIVSSVEIKTADQLEGVVETENFPGLKIFIEPSGDSKCERCWVHDPNVGSNPDYPTICLRCIEAMKEQDGKGR
ncbi:MAG: class I tRNA ligase family protein, partial [Desulfatiglandaceae bacterium]